MKILSLETRRKKFELVLVHNIDSLYKWKSRKLLFKTMERDILKQRNRNLAISRINHYIKIKQGETKDPYDNFSYIMKLESKYGLKSSFYFMSGGNTKYDASYSMKESYIISLIKTLQEEGFEVGLHPSFNSYNNFQMANLEKKKLEKVAGNAIWGGRQDCLRRC